MQQAISCQNLTKHFGEKKAVQGLDLEIGQGEVFGFLGPNGAGKTTTVRLLNGLLAPTSGSATVLGMNILEDASAIRASSGVLTETPGLYESLTLEENLRFYGELYRVPANDLDKRITDLLEEFDLVDRAHDHVGTLSKGLHQRMAILRALIHDPQILFLDEPTAGLDPAATRQVIELISDMSQKRGRTVFLCTHNLDVAQKLCDRIGVIDHGILQAVGTPKELASELWRQCQVELVLGNVNDSRLDALREAPFMLNLAVHGDQVSVTLSDDEKIPELTRWLVQNELDVYSVTPQQHTLEDIYFKIQGNDESEAGE